MSVYCCGNFQIQFLINQAESRIHLTGPTEHYPTVSITTPHVNTEEQNLGDTNTFSLHVHQDQHFHTDIHSTSVLQPHQHWAASVGVTIITSITLSLCLWTKLNHLSGAWFCVAARECGRLARHLPAAGREAVRENPIGERFNADHGGEKFLVLLPSVIIWKMHAFPAVSRGWRNSGLPCT